MWALLEDMERPPRLAIDCANRAVLDTLGGARAVFEEEAVGVE